MGVHQMEEEGCRVLYCHILIAEFYDIRVKGQKVVRACTIRLLNLGPAKHEKVAIYVVNQRISNVCGIAGA